MTTKPERKNIIRFKISNSSSGTRQQLNSKKIECPTNRTGEIGGSTEFQLPPSRTPEIADRVLKKNTLDDESLKIEESKEKPWKLRKRSSSSSEPNSENPYKRFNKRFEIEENGNKVVKANRTKPSVSLTKKEIDEDFMAILGHKPPLRETAGSADSIDDEVSQLTSTKNSLDELGSKPNTSVIPWKLRKRSSSRLEPNSKNPNKRCNKVVKTAKEQPVKFSVSLSKKEIEEDFMAMVGQKPPSRPKKRPRNVQEALDNLFPGLYLGNVKAKDYKVPGEPK